MDDPYCYPPPHNDILINKPGLLDNDKLQAFETAKSAVRFDTLLNKPIIGSFNQDHLQKIHQYIFQDVYPWAGEIRSISIFKSERILSGASVNYSSPGLISDDLKTALAHLKSINFERNVFDVSKDLSKTVPAIWQIHPFREGNTRSLAAFIASYTKTKGFEIDPYALAKHYGKDSFRDAMVASCFDMPEHAHKRFISAREAVINRHKSMPLDRSRQGIQYGSDKDRSR